MLFRSGAPLLACGVPGRKVARENVKAVLTAKPLDLPAFDRDAPFLAFAPKGPRPVASLLEALNKARRAGAVIAFVILAVHIALVDGQARSLVADLVPRERRASAFGRYHAAVGLALLPASLIAGQLWQRVGGAAPFAFGATCALAAALMFAWSLPAHREHEARHG